MRMKPIPQLGIDLLSLGDIKSTRAVNSEQGCSVLCYTTAPFDLSSAKTDYLPDPSGETISSSHNHRKCLLEIMTLNETTRQ